MEDRETFLERRNHTRHRLHAGAIRSATFSAFTLLGASMALLPVAVTGPAAASDRTVAVLFRGYPGPSGTQGVTGMDDLAGTLSDAFRSAGRSFSSRVFAYDRKVDALNFITGFRDDVGCLVVIGHSWGGDEAIELASDARVPVAVDVLVQLDSWGRGDEVLPSGVRRGLNYYQISTSLWEIQGATSVRGSTNVHVEGLYEDQQVTDADITHTQIDDALFGRTAADYARVFGSEPDLHDRITGELMNTCS